MLVASGQNGITQQSTFDQLQRETKHSLIRNKSSLSLSFMKHKALLLGLFAALAPGQTIPQPSRSVADPGVVTTRQAITPAGVPSVFQGRVYGVSWGVDDAALWVLHASELYKLDWRNNKVLSRVTHGGVPGNGGLQTDRTTGAALVSQSAKANSRLISVDAEGIKPVASELGRYNPGALAVASETNGDGRRFAVVPLVWENALALIDMVKREMVSRVAVGVAPFAAVIDRKGTTAFVSNLGGRSPKKGELFASSAEKMDEQIAVDKRGIAVTGTVTRVDLLAGKSTHTIAVGLHPTGMKWDEAHDKLYVANGNSDSVTVIDTKSNQVTRTIDLQPFSQRVRGIAPTAIETSPDGLRLYVACGGINAVAVLDANSGALKGLIPTAWYPNSLSLSPSGAHLAVGALLGAGSGWRENPGKRFVHANRGSVAVVAVPNAAELASYTTAVAENNRLRLPGTEPARAVSANTIAAAVPVRSGEPSLIEHVVFIVKENRTYDQVLGDMTKGNGDASLVMFGEEVTPNQHRLADQFVLLDNFYATGGNSADGHQWLTQANETEYCLWPGYQGRSYPFDGSDPLAYSSGGFLWDYALARGRSVKVYGEYAGRTSASAQGRMQSLLKWKNGGDFTGDWRTHAPIEPLNKILAANYPAYSTGIPDVARAQIYLTDLKSMRRTDRCRT